MQTEMQPIQNQFPPMASVGVGMPANSEDIYDANRRRLGFVCGFTEIELTALESGLQTPFLPAGKLIKFVASQIRQPTYEIEDPDKPSSKLVTFSAKTFMDSTVQKTGRPDGFIGNKETDYGVRSLSMLVGLQYKESYEDGQHIIYDDFADMYFDVVYPSVETRGPKFVCKEKLADCPTCSLEWLQSDELAERIRTAVSEYQYDGVVLNQLRQTLFESVSQTVRHANKMWRIVLGDIEQAKQGNPGKKVLDGADHHIRKMLHQVEPNLQQTNAIIEASRETGRVMAQTTADAFSKAIENFQGQSGQNNQIAAENEELKTSNTQMLEMLEKVQTSLGGLNEKFAVLDDLRSRLDTIEERFKASPETPKMPETKTETPNRLPKLKTK